MKKRSKACKLNTKSNQEIQRHWGDVEVIDAKKDLRVFIKPEDVASAKSKDPGCCVFAQACKRQFAATKVIFWKSVAYVELPGPDGKRRVERFHLPAGMRILIEEFDRGNPIPLSAGFELQTPSQSKTFGAQQADLMRHRSRKKAAIDGTSTGTGRGKGAYERPPIVIDLQVRNGKGMVHFKKTAGAEGGS